MPIRLLCLFFALLSVNARADRCSIEGHEQEFTDFYEAAIRKSLASLPKKSGFAMSPDSLELKVTSSTTSDDEYLPLPELDISGTFASEKGTEFDIVAHGASIYSNWNGQNVEFGSSVGEVLFTPTLLSRGHDREGNPIGARCWLTTKAYFDIRNTKNGKIITRFELPSSITINISETK